MSRAKRRTSRRRFLEKGAAAAAGAAILAGAPRVVTASRTSDEVIVGQGDYRYRIEHGWSRLPDRYTWQTTHGVAVDKSGHLYVIHKGDDNRTDHPSIFVFDSEGKFIRAFGSQFQGGGHGLEVRQEGSEEFLYVAAYQQIKTIVKLTLTGEIVWERHAPMESGVYREGEDSDRTKARARDRFAPTNFAFADDGGFWLADGYGSFRIHRYDTDGVWVSCFGGPGTGEGTFQLPHGLWLDKRKGREPELVVTDRVHGTLQTFTPDGQYRQTVKGFGLPANIDVWENLMLVTELQARVSLLNEKNEVVARLGSGQERLEQIQDLRDQPGAWKDGQFIHPHDACFTSAGDIVVAEWVGTGRLSKLTRI